MKNFRKVLGVVALLGCGVWITAHAQAKEDDRLTITVAGVDKAYTLAQLKKALKPVSVTIDDPVYGKQKAFEGFVLAELLSFAGAGPQATADEIVFTAKDGYAPNTTFQKVREHRAILTFRETGAKGEAFGKVHQGKALISPAPYYLVWEEGKSLEKDVPWPYQLVKIEIVSFTQKYPNLLPWATDPQSKVMKGFQIFKDSCVRCHSVNLQGGDLGPELNVPQNVTEYWDKGTIKKFIENPLAFRLKSKMPPFPQLKGEGIDQVVDYLEAMKERKLVK